MIGVIVWQMNVRQLFDNRNMHLVFDLRTDTLKKDNQYDY